MSLRKAVPALRRAAWEASAARHIGSKTPGEDWGQPATGGTAFLGTPENYKELLNKRPVSPDVFGLDGKPHYAFPAAALSSITTRVTGCVLSGVVIGGGVVHLAGDLPTVVEAVKSLGPLATVPIKFSLAFPIIFHTLSGFRHLIWDYTLRGIDNQSAELTSRALFATSLVSAAAAAAM